MVLDVQGGVPSDIPVASRRAVVTDMPGGGLGHAWRWSRTCLAAFWDMPCGMSLHDRDFYSLGDNGRIMGDVKTIP